MILLLFSGRQWSCYSCLALNCIAIRCFCLAVSQCVCMRAHSQVPVCTTLVDRECSSCRVFASGVYPAAAVHAKKLPDPENKSFSAIASLCACPLFLVCVNVFLTVAKDITTLLTSDQVPVRPAHAAISCSGHTGMCSGHPGTLVKPDILTTHNSTSKLLVFAPECRAQHVNASRVNIACRHVRLYRSVLYFTTCMYT